MTVSGFIEWRKPRISQKTKLFCPDYQNNNSEMRPEWKWKWETRKTILIIFMFIQNIWYCVYCLSPPLYYTLSFDMHDIRHVASRDDGWMGNSKFPKFNHFRSMYSFPFVHPHPIRCLVYEYIELGETSMQEQKNAKRSMKNAYKKVHAIKRTIFPFGVCHSVPFFYNLINIYYKKPRILRISTQNNCK